MDKQINIRDVVNGNQQKREISQFDVMYYPDDDSSDEEWSKWKAVLMENRGKIGQQIWWRSQFTKSLVESHFKFGVHRILDLHPETTDPNFIFQGVLEFLKSEAETQSNFPILLIPGAGNNSTGLYAGWNSVLVILILKILGVDINEICGHYIVQILPEHFSILETWCSLFDTMTMPEVEEIIYNEDLTYIVWSFDTKTTTALAWSRFVYLAAELMMTLTKIECQHYCYDTFGEIFRRDINTLFYCGCKGKRKGCKSGEVISKFCELTMETYEEVELLVPNEWLLPNNIQHHGPSNCLACRQEREQRYAILDDNANYAKILEMDLDLDLSTPAYS